MKLGAGILLGALFGVVLCLAALLPSTRKLGARGQRTATPPLSGNPVARPRQPAPPVAAAANTGSAEGQQPVAVRPPGWVAGLLNGEWPRKLTTADLKSYLEQHRRSPDALLAAMQMTGDTSLLEEAARNYTNDAKVAFAAFFQAKSPADKRRWIDTVKQASPESALGFYLSAREYFNAGQPDKAVEELMTASTKPVWQDFSAELMLNAQEACLAAGFSETQAKVVSTLALPLPQLAQLRDLGKQIGELAAGYRNAGDEASAAAATQIGLGLVRRIAQGAGPDYLIQDLVAISTERNLLTTVEPAILYDESGRTVKDRLAELDQQKNEIKELVKPSEAVMASVSEQDLALFVERWRLTGERSAMRWLMARQNR